MLSILSVGPNSKELVRFLRNWVQFPNEFSGGPLLRLGLMVPRHHHSDIMHKSARVRDTSATHKRNPLT